MDYGFRWKIFSDRALEEPLACVEHHKKRDELPADLENEREPPVDGSERVPASSSRRTHICGLCLSHEPGWYRAVKIPGSSIVTIATPEALVSTRCSATVM